MPEETGIPENRGYTNVTLPLRRVMLNNFLGGISWGIGTFIGAGLVVGVVLWALNQTGLLPQLGATFEEFKRTVESLRTVR
jgi:hypothetical protein